LRSSGPCRSDCSKSRLRMLSLATGRKGGMEEEITFLVLTFLWGLGFCTGFLRYSGDF
jgi:hypothetical protein